MKTKWKITLGAVVVLFVAAFAVTQLMQGVEAEVKKVTPRDLARSFTEEGEVVPLKERKVYALYNARLAELLVEEGDQVSQGELLAVLEDDELTYSLKEMQAKLGALEGEKMQLEEEPAVSKQESYELRVDEAEDSLEAAKRNLERMQTIHQEGYELRVRDAEKNLEVAKRNYDRVKKLYEADVVSRADYEEASDEVIKAESLLAQQEQELRVFSEAEYEQAEEMVQKAEYNLAQQEKALQVLHESYQPPEGSREVIASQREAIHAQIDLLNHKMNNHSITAPISGIITDINKREGELAGSQASLMRIMQNDEHQVEARVLTRDIYDIYEGMSVNLILELRDDDVVFPGEVIEIAPYAEKDYSPLGLEEERVKVTIVPDRPEDLYIAPGYKLDVEFTTEKQSDVLVVPQSALFTFNGEDALLVVEHDQVAVRAVKTGLETRRDVVITEGLQEEDLVILDPQAEDYSEGDRVSYSVVN